MKSRLVSSIAILFLMISIAQAQSEHPVIIGHKYHIISEILNEEREYWISLPQSYEYENQSHKKYPILILLDGNVHFHSISGMVNTMSSGRSDKREIPEMIIIAILNVNRERDFTPDKIITKRENQTGGADDFLAFLESELIPKIEREYRTTSYRMLIGYSLGGLFATHAYLKESSSFNSFISIDPSLGTWDNKVMDEKLSNITNKVFQRPYYLATANWGKRSSGNRDKHVSFYELMKVKSTKDFNTSYKYYPNKNHSSIPLPAIYDGLLHIFRGYLQPYREIKDIDELINNYQQISQRNSHDFRPPENLVNRIGYRLLRSLDNEEMQLALNFFLLNTKNYPDSYNVFDSLGEAYYQLGNHDLAIDNFKHSIELNPNNKNAREMINMIKKQVRDE